ncbi:MAG: 50S ribosomal protein L29 [Parachlamydiaceae bacterium]
MSKAKEFRDQTVEELEALEADKRREYFTLASKREKEKKLDNPQVLRNIRRDVARILTVLNEKKLGK